jgi:hypothetical protein
MKIVKEKLGIVKDMSRYLFGLGDNGILYLKYISLIDDKYNDQEWVRLSLRGYHFELEDMIAIVNEFGKLLILL